MKWLTSFLTLMLLGINVCFATTAQSQLEEIKALAGNWEVKTPDGMIINITYEPISGGTAVMEIMKLPDGTDMRSIYHMNGEKLMLTHYCESGNQPRLAASGPATANSFTLSFVDATNIPSPKTSAYLYRVLFRFKDQESFEQEITWMIRGKESTNTWKLQRKK